MSGELPSELCGGILALAAAGWTISSATGKSRNAPAPWWWYVVTFAAALAFRWPRLIAPNEFSPDESQSLAGAMTLLHDPRFWVSVDGATAGPLHFFAQVPAAVLPGPAYLGVRILALLCVLGIVVAAVNVGACSARAKQITILATVLAHASSRMPDFQHLSTELVPVLLISLGLLTAFRGGVVQSWTRSQAAVAGLLLSAAPLSKLQVAPLALAALLLIAVVGFRNSPRGALTALFVGAVLPWLLTLTYLRVAGVWSGAVVPYLLNNVAYVGDSGFTVATAVRGLCDSLWNDGYAAAWIGVTVVVVAGAWIFCRQSMPGSRTTLVLAATWLVLSGMCVLVPLRPYPHYIYLLLPSAALILGLSVTAILDSSERWLPSLRALVPAGLLAAFVLPGAVLHASAFDRYAWLTRVFVRWHRENVAMAEAMRPFQTTGDSLAVWGSRSDLYVTTRLFQAIPEAHTQTQLGPGSWQSYFLQTYAEAFTRNRPAFFVDSVGPGNFLFENRSVAHEAFPPLRAAVRDGYTLVAELHGARIYVRNDRMESVRRAH